MEAPTASSRIFIKGLPPTLTDVEFRKHFSQHGREVTDAKIFPNRRIGYIGYKTAEDAQKAVKYFNRTFMRMSKIGVEIARPAKSASESQQRRNAPTAKKASGTSSVDVGVKRKRESGSGDKEDPKLKEFIQVMKPKSKKKAGEMEGGNQDDDEGGTSKAAELAQEGQSDDDYEDVPKKSKRAKSEAKRKASNPPAKTALDVPMDDAVDVDADATHERDSQPGEGVSRRAASDADWARSKTSRLLGLVDADEDNLDAEQQKAASLEMAGDEDASESEGAPAKGERKSQGLTAESSMPTPPSDDQLERSGSKETVSADIAAVRSSMRLFLRNLSYDITQDDLESEFAAFGELDEVHVPLDKRSGASKGFAYIQFTDADAAENALVSKDGETFQGRLLHVLPAQAKRESKLNDFDLSKLPLKKQQQIKRRREAANTNFNWNSLYMNQDAVISSVANSLGIAKSDVLDPTSGDAAVRQAHAETHVISETKAFFQQQGVDLDAFKRSARGDTAILVKNIPHDCSRDELERLFGEHGEFKRFLMPPSGVIAIVEFANEAQCKTAFGALAYKKIKSSVLFLEKAPKGLFDVKSTSKAAHGSNEGITKASATDLKDTADSSVQDTPGSATLFVRNLNFSTTDTQLTRLFSTLSGFLNARVKTKTDPKKPGQVLSMGFGFVEFRTSKDAQSALKVMDGEILEGHKLQVRASHKGADAAEERRKQDQERKASSAKTKIIIKNLPFEASKKDVRALFGAYGQLRSVRVPKKMDSGARGFAFADFTTAKEARSAMEALKDTHLLGRRLVLEFVEAEPEDAEAEIEKMSRKVGAQADRVRVQGMVEGGKRKRFRIGEGEEE